MRIAIMSTKELERGRIIPDVVDSVNPHSKTQISVTYGSIPVILGELITPKDVSRGYASGREWVSEHGGVVTSARCGVPAPRP